MSNDTTTAPSCLGRLFRPSHRKALAHPASSAFSTSSRAIAQISASGLVLASAGFGAYYAWTTGLQHGYALACLMVVMAVALELAKPLSLAAAFAAFRSWSVLRGAVLALLAAVAIAYSLTAELSLMATSRGDAVAAREAVFKAASNGEADGRRARERHDQAKAELDTLPSARPARELQAEIDGLLLTPGAEGCVAINGKVTRDVCPKVVLLRVEKARADRREELQQTLTQPLPTPAVVPTAHKVVGASDPGASALSAYLAVFGVIITPAILSEWLVLVGVLALEVGSASAMLLVQGVAVPRRVDATAPGPAVNSETRVQKEHKAVVQVVHRANTSGSDDTAQAREKVKDAIVGRLREQGGSVKGGERGLAKLIGTNRSTMKRAMNGLVLAGVIAAEATRNGTMIRLLA